MVRVECSTLHALGWRSITRDRALFFIDKFIVMNQQKPPSGRIAIIYVVNCLTNILINFDHGIIPACTTEIKLDLKIDDFEVGCLSAWIVRYLGIISLCWITIWLRFGIPYFWSLRIEDNSRLECCNVRIQSGPLSTHNLTLRAHSFTLPSGLLLGEPSQ